MPDPHPSYDYCVDPCGKHLYRLKLQKLSAFPHRGNSDIRVAMRAVVVNSAFILIYGLTRRYLFRDHQTLRATLIAVLGEEPGKVDATIQDMFYAKVCCGQPQKFINWRKLLRRSRSET